MGAHTNPRSLLASERGTALTEFRLIAPTFAMLLTGTLDLAHSLYMQVV